MSSDPQVYATRVLEAFEQAGLYTDDEIKAAGGPSSSTMTKLRAAAAGQRMLDEPRGDTHRRIDTAVRWRLGSSRGLWRYGMEPVPLDAVVDDPLRRAILESRDLDEDTRAALLDLLDSRRPPPQSPQHHQSA